MLAVGIAVAYFVAGKIGLSLAYVHVSATAVWPPTGIAIAALLIFGTRVWPGVLLGAFLVNATTAGSVATSLGIASGNALEAVVAALLVRRWANGRRAFERPADVLRFALLAAVVATTISATVGVTSLALTGYAEWSDAGPIWFTWWLGDAAGALVVAPFLLLWADLLWARQPWGWVDARRWPEALALVAGVALTGLVVFHGEPFSVKNYPNAYLTFPVLVWAAYRFGPPVSASVVAALSAIAIAGMVRGYGPFVRDDPNVSLLLLQGFISIASVVSLTLAAAVLERRRMVDELRAAEEQLRRAEERKVAARDEFLSVAAHELKTPITSLRLAVQHLVRQSERGALDQRGLARALATVDEQSTRLTRLVTQLLDTVRLQADRLELEVEVADVTAIVTRSVEDARAASERHEIVVTAPPSLPAMVDALRLEQVMANLLDNAIKFSPDGGRIDVSVSRRDGGVRLEVRDHGIGIPVAERVRVFERFHQAHGDDHRFGLGLGLYVSKQIVDRHGGRIEVEGPDSGGTRVVVCIPGAIDGAAAVAPQVAS